MKPHFLKVSLLIIVLLLVLTLMVQKVSVFKEPTKARERTENTAISKGAEDVRHYFPAFQGAIYHFAGEGMEFASFARTISYVSQGLLQMEDASGTNLAQVVEHGPDKIRIFWTEAEFYEERSILEPEARGVGQNVDLLPLKAPLKPGATWHDERFRREILKVDQVVTVPAGTFAAVVVVKAKNHETEGFVQYEYYAKNVGLIKRESIFVDDGQTYEVVSALRRFVLNPR